MSGCQPGRQGVGWGEGPRKGNSTCEHLKMRERGAHSETHTSSVWLKNGKALGCQGGDGDM